MTQQRQQQTYPQYGGIVRKAEDDGRKKIAMAVIVLGLLGVVWGLVAAPQGKVSPELRLLGPDESKLVTIICSPCEPNAAKAIVGDENFFGSPAPDRFVVRATGAQISQMESLGWVKYIAR